MKNKHKIYSYNIDQLIYTSKSLFFFHCDVLYADFFGLFDWEHSYGLIIL